MQSADFSTSSPYPERVRLRTLSPGDRTRTSGPGLRTFSTIADQFGLSVADRIAVLGDPSGSTYHRWMKKAREDGPLTLPLDTLLRISAILGTYKALAILFEDHNQAMVWLKSPHHGTLFAGALPITFMLEGGLDGLMAVRRYLDAWCVGHMGHGGCERGLEPVTEGDLVFAPASGLT